MDSKIIGREFDISEISEIPILINNELSEDEIKILIELSRKARDNSYSPYSKFKVGCCLVTTNGEFILGTNVENLSYGITVCAERSAICNAISNGFRSFKAAFITTDMDYYVSPCGTCRQVLQEFGIKHCFLLINQNKLIYFTIDYLLPYGVVIPHLKNK